MGSLASISHSNTYHYRMQPFLPSLHQFSQYLPGLSFLVKHFHVIKFLQDVRIFIIFCGLLFDWQYDWRRHHTVVSLIGVILIARPTFLFGDSEAHHTVGEINVADDVLKKVSSAQRLLAVGSVFFSVSLISSIYPPFFLVRVSLFSVIGSTGACSSVVPPNLKNRPNSSYTVTTLRAIGKRAHPLHSMSYFSAVCVLNSTLGYVVFWPLSLLL